MSNVEQATIGINSPSYKMKSFVLIAFFALSAHCYADTVEEGNYIVVRGVIKGCEKWTNRVLEVVKVDGPHSISLLGIPEIEVIHQSAQQVKSQLENQVEERTGNRPTSLGIEILGSEVEYRSITYEYRVSLGWSLG